MSLLFVSAVLTTDQVGSDIPGWMSIFGDRGLWVPNCLASPVSSLLDYVTLWLKCILHLTFFVNHYCDERHWIGTQNEASCCGSHATLLHWDTPDEWVFFLDTSGLFWEIEKH